MVSTKKSDIPNTKRAAKPKTTKPKAAPKKQTKRSPRNSKKTSARKRTVPNQPKEMSTFMKYLIAGCIIIVFSFSFYFLFIRPYAYRWRPCHGRKWYGDCMPCCYDVHGIDISHYQGEIDWNELKTSKTSEYPIEFIFIKATEGGDHKDSTFTRNFESARKHGLIRGAYHFFTPHTDPVKQAEFYIQNVKLKAGDLPPVLDIELKGKNEDDEIKQRVKIWMECIEKHYGVKPILYTSYKFKEKYLNDSTINTYPYWIAHYYVDSVKYKGEWKFWQHTDIGTVPGIGEDVDLDVFNGSLEQLKQFTIK